MDWEHRYVIGVHVRTGGVSREGTRWGRFLNEKDVKVFHRYASSITLAYEADVLWEFCIIVIHRNH